MAATEKTEDITMYPAKFDYFRANSVAEAISLLQQHGDAKVLAVLTADQKAQFEKMQGKKIEIDRQALGRGFGGRGRRGGGNQ
jgi:CO/xanthine dehydrogenase FAD-binding subunit